MGKEHKAKPKFRRKQVLVDKSFQFRYALYVVLALTLAFLVIFGNFYVGIWTGIVNALSNDAVRADLLSAEQSQQRAPGEYGDLEEYRIPLIEPAKNLSRGQRRVVSDIIHETNRKLIPSFIVLLLLAVWITILVTHRVAGPLYRIRADLRHVDDGDLSCRIHLRKKDEGKELAADINRMIEEFDVTVRLLRKIIHDHESDFEGMKTRLKAELGKFKTGDDIP